MERRRHFRSGRATAAGRIVWLALLAVLIQVNAPVRSTLMALQDPASAALCAIHTHHGAVSELDRKSPAPPTDRCSDCPVCHIAGPGPEPAPVILPTAVAVYAPPMRPADAEEPGPPPPIHRFPARGPPTAA